MSAFVEIIFDNTDNRIPVSQCTCTCNYMHTVHLHATLTHHPLFSMLDTWMTDFCTRFSRLGVPEQALDGIPLGLGLVMMISVLNSACVLTHRIHSHTSCVRLMYSAKSLAPFLCVISSVVGEV